MLHVEMLDTIIKHLILSTLLLLWQRRKELFFLLFVAQQHIYFTQW